MNFANHNLSAPCRHQGHTFINDKQFNSIFFHATNSMPSHNSHSILILLVGVKEVEVVGPIVHLALMPRDPSTNFTTNQVTMLSVNGTSSILLFSLILTIINLQFILLENNHHNGQVSKHSLFHSKL